MDVASVDKQAPLCVLVEFDDINLGFDTVVGPDGKPRSVRRMFFPELEEVLGLDAKGEPRAWRVVPIYRESRSSSVDDDVSRSQFPLTLAWALTHWKAQGMTLGPYRVRMGKRIAAAPGIPYVAVSRAKHPRHVCFDVDLQDYDVFTEAQWTKNFRARRRYDLRLQAKFSRTLRKYGYCRADLWDRGDAELAEKLLEGLKKVRGHRRGSTQHLGANIVACEDPKNTQDSAMLC